MKLKVRCSQCQAAIESRGEPDAIIGVSGMLSLTPRPFHVWACARGHRNWIWLAHPFHEVLLYRGIQELASDDTRAAVMSLYSAWDNFLLYWVREMHTPPEPGAAPPKPLLRAEPVLGLYSGLYFSQVGSWPRVVTDGSRTLRNKVAHDMHIPTTAEVLKLGVDVQECMRAGIEPVREQYESWIGGHLAHARMVAAIESAPPEVDTALTVLGLERSFSEVDLATAMHAADRVEVGVELWTSVRR